MLSYQRMRDPAHRGSVFHCTPICALRRHHLLKYLTTCRLRAVVAQVKEIGVHETEIFKVIVRKNGRRMTITPALSRSAKEAHDIYLERVRQANLLGQAGKQMRTSYKCPFMMANCNGQSMRCARCKPLLGEWVKKPKWPTCPFGTATCTHESRACVKCRQQQDKR
jgi:hypothetical protein